jgi:ParB family chromosome partitioning protein
MRHFPDTIYNINLNEIYADKLFNTRGLFHPGTCRELAEDIRQKGLMHPIVLRERDKDESGPNVARMPYSLVVGFRRYEAFKILKVATIPATFRELSYADAVLMNVSENIQRKDIGIKQEVEIISTLIDRGLSSVQIRDSLGKNINWVTNRIFIGRLPKDIREKVYDGEITISKAVDISRETNPSLQKIALEELFALEERRLRKMKDKDGVRGIRYTYRKLAHFKKMTGYLKDKLPEEKIVQEILAWAILLKSSKDLKESFEKHFNGVDFEDFPIFYDELIK